MIGRCSVSSQGAGGSLFPFNGAQQGPHFVVTLPSGALQYSVYFQLQ